eukprot:TRINITY_DN679_c0_g1_i6.p3 TRINITY_DN679_c0_g1~~TRINITY_DN679_c0_g1_i6.p3  ORF type:complete len:139 (+),score=27.19 TRINITY_DN679_c0_g1_i6:236-652(+)
MGRSLVALVATLLLTAVAAPAVVAARDAPWDIKGLQPALRVAKLQAPTSKDGQRDLVGFSSQYFYREGAVMKFKIGGDGRRSELRFNEGSEWSLGDAHPEEPLWEIAGEEAAERRGRVHLDASARGEQKASPPPDVDA